jgi:phosphoribosylglycinamide formyltransferase 1
VNVGVLASGAGTNLQALIDTVHGHEVDIVGVASDQPQAAALQRAASAGIETAVFARDAHPDRAARDDAIADWLDARDVELVVTAGYMALLSAGFVARFRDAILNVHPSLLPAFPGLDAVGQALAAGVRVYGVTVHLIDEGTDTGPIVAQRAVELPDATTRDEVLAALRPLEHALLPQAVRQFADHAIRRDPGNARRIIVGR